MTDLVLAIVLVVVGAVVGDSSAPRWLSLAIYGLAAVFGVLAVLALVHVR